MIKDTQRSDADVVGRSQNHNCVIIVIVCYTYYYDTGVGFTSNPHPYSRDFPDKSHKHNT